MDDTNQAPILSQEDNVGFMPDLTTWVPNQAYIRRNTLTLEIDIKKLIRNTRNALDKLDKQKGGSDGT